MKMKITLFAVAVVAVGSLVAAGASAAPIARGEYVVTWPRADGSGYFEGTVTWEDYQPGAGVCSGLANLQPEPYLECLEWVYGFDFGSDFGGRSSINPMSITGFTTPNPGTPLAGAVEGTYSSSWEMPDLSSGFLVFELSGDGVCHSPPSYGTCGCASPNPDGTCAQTVYPFSATIVGDVENISQSASPQLYNYQFNYLPSDFADGLYLVTYSVDGDDAQCTLVYDPANGRYVQQCAGTMVLNATITGTFNTPPGGTPGDPNTNETVQIDTSFYNPNDGVTYPISVEVTYDAVTAPGTTTVTTSSTAAGNFDPNFLVVVDNYGGVFFDVSFEGGLYEGPVRVCGHYPDVNDDGIVDGTSDWPECFVQLAHKATGENGFGDSTMLTNDPRCPWDDGEVTAFVTKSRRPSDIGVDGADAVCQWEAEDANLEGTFRAWLSTDSYSPATDWDIAGSDLLISGPFGIPIASSWDQLVSGALNHQINRTTDRQWLTPVGESSLLNAFVTADTHLGGFGVADADELCQTDAEAAGLPGTYRAWLSTDSYSPATDWDLAGTDYQFVRTDGALIANSWEHLVSETLMSPISMTADGTMLTSWEHEAVAFLSHDQTNGAGLFSISCGYDDCGYMADQHCQWEAEDANLEGTFRAWLSTAYYSPATHWDVWNSYYPIVRPDGARVFGSYSTMATGILANPINLHASGSAAPPTYWGAWTGTTRLGTAQAGASYPEDNNCLSWTSDGLSGDIKIYGTIGDPDSTGWAWTEARAPDGFPKEAWCIQELPFYCFQQGVAGIPAEPLAWTGTRTDGTWEPGLDCNGWTSNYNHREGLAGAALRTDGTWTDWGTRGCRRSHHFFCFQQRSYAEANYQVWTGTQQDGTSAAGSSCNGWTSVDETQNATIGSVLQDDAGWTVSEAVECGSASRRFYCFEQTDVAKAAATCRTWVADPDPHNPHTWATMEHLCINTQTEEVCGLVDGLSPFVVGLDGGNEPPAVTQPFVIPVPQAVGRPLAASGSVCDPDVDQLLITEIDWGDGTVDQAGPESGLCGQPLNGTHTYAEAGVYAVTMTVSDDRGEFDSQSAYAVIYDPSGRGFVTGGGWIDSPPGAYAADPDLTGKATFGFVSKYKKGANAPTGNTEFQFKVADLNFKSTSYQWLVVAGPKAKFKGDGTINGAGNYGFMLTAIDASLAGGGDADKFRIKIWGSTGVVYDNQMGDDDNADAATDLGGGTVVIHKAKK